MRLHKGKSKRSLLFASITAAAVVVLLVINIVLSHLTLFKAFYIDLTPEELYTATDRLIEELEFVDELGKTDGDKEVKITFCTDPDYLTETAVTRYTYFLALKLQNKFKNLKVECINVAKQPQLLSKYKTTSLSVIEASNIIVSYGDRYRIVGAMNFWTTDYFSYDGERFLASLIRSVTAEQRTAYFVTDNGAEYYDVTKNEADQEYLYLYEMIKRNGMNVETLSLYDEQYRQIPSDCALLLILNPKSDFASDGESFDSFEYISPLEKVDRYLMNNQGAVIATRDFDNGAELKNYDDFLHEWGFDVGSTMVKDNENAIYGNDGEKVPSSFEINYEANLEGAAAAIYGDFANLISAPSTVVSNSGYIECSYGKFVQKNESGSMIVTRNYQPFFTTYDTAGAYVADSDGSFVDSTVREKNGPFDLASICIRENFNTVSSEYTYSYLFCSATTDIFKNEILSVDAYANYEITSSLIENISKIDDFASIDLGGSSYNSKKFGGKQILNAVLKAEDEIIYGQDSNGKLINKKTNYGINTATKIVFSVAVAIVPVSALVIGVVTVVKRKNL